MRLYSALIMLAFLSGVPGGAEVLASETKVPLPDTDKPVFNNRSKQLENGVPGDIGQSLPMIDNILKQGIKMPDEATGDAAEVKESGVREEYKGLEKKEISKPEGALELPKPGQPEPKRGE
jgi:hypothetical protein